MKPLKNPFITSGYESAEYFCDREQESENLIREVINGNNLALISTRRMGKTGLIQHCFNSPEIKDNYYTFFVDIYATKSLRDLVFSLSRVIVDGLKPSAKKPSKVSGTASNPCKAALRSTRRVIPASTCNWATSALRKRRSTRYSAIWRKPPVR